MASVRAPEIEIPTTMTNVSEALARPPGEDGAAQRERVLTYVEQIRSEHGIERDPELRVRLRARAAAWPA